jgi:hypothetical protein
MQKNQISFQEAEHLAAQIFKEIAFSDDYSMQLTDAIIFALRCKDIDEMPELRKILLTFLADLHNLAKDKAKILF